MRWTSPLLIAACGVFGLPASWKSHAQQPAFEVVSIKPTGDDPPMMTFGPELRNGTLLGQKVTLRIMLAVAYGIAEPRIIGPSWLDKNRFDMAGKSPQGIPDSDLKPMLQSLLRDRFKLKSHFEKREMPVYYLTVAKGGVTMPKYGDSDRRPEPDMTKYAGFPMMRGAFTMPLLAISMARLVGRPVIDNTDLTARYSVFLSFAPLSPPTGERVPEFSPPDLFKAVQEQLGLRLQAGKGDVEVVVVDHIEQMPTEN